MMTLLILGVGILGLSAANVLALRARAQSALESAATQHASEMIERMRARAHLARSGAYNRDLLTPAPESAAAGTVERDLETWLVQLGNRLPSGAAAITVTPDGRAQVTLQWSTPMANEGTRHTASVTLRSRL